MKKNIIVNKEFVVIWIPHSFYIFLESKKNFDRQVKFEVYENKPIKTKEFNTFEEADKFTDELWEM